MWRSSYKSKQKYKNNYENIYLKLFMFIAYNLLPETFVYFAELISKFWHHCQFLSSLPLFVYNLLQYFHIKHVVDMHPVPYYFNRDC